MPSLGCVLGSQPVAKGPCTEGVGHMRSGESQRGTLSSQSIRTSLYAGLRTWKGLAWGPTTSAGPARCRAPGSYRHPYSSTYNCLPGKG